MMVSRRLPAITAALAAVTLGCPGPAVADPATPVDAPPVETTPAPAPPVAGIGSALAQSGSAPSGPLGLPDLSAYASSLILGQNPVPAAPGESVGVAVPDLSVFNPGYLLPQNLDPAAPGAGTPAPGFGPDEDSPGTGRIAFLRRIYEMYQAGALDGALLGQQSPEEFAQQALDSAPPTPPGCPGRDC